MATKVADCCCALQQVFPGLAFSFAALPGEHDSHSPVDIWNRVGVRAYELVASTNICQQRPKAGRNSAPSARYDTHVLLPLESGSESQRAHDRQR